MKSVVRTLRLGSSLMRTTKLQYCSTAGSSSSTTATSDSSDIFDDFVDSLGRDVTDMNKPTTIALPVGSPFTDVIVHRYQLASPQVTGLTFSRMLRQSKFVQLGDYNGRLITGKIVHRVQDDLYIDIGLKFNTVCKAPAVNSEAYREGAAVLLRLHDPELSERFLGSEHDLTLLEADATLMRLLRPASGKGERVRKPLNTSVDASSASATDTLATAA